MPSMDGMQLKKSSPARVTEGLEDSQAIALIHTKQGIMQHQQLPTDHAHGNHTTTQMI